MRTANRGDYCLVKGTKSMVQKPHKRASSGSDSE